jgi:hypothetical protein
MQEAAKKLEQQAAATKLAVEATMLDFGSPDDQQVFSRELSVVKSRFEALLLVHEGTEQALQEYLARHFNLCSLILIMMQQHCILPLLAMPAFKRDHWISGTGGGGQHTLAFLFLHSPD